MPEPECLSASLNDQITFTGQCVRDDPINRVLSGAFYRFADSPSMTMEGCRDKCDGYAYYGLENGNECFCGHEYRLPLEMVNQAECDMECPGDAMESCGGFLRMNIWSQDNLKFNSFFAEAEKIWKGQCVENDPNNLILRGPSTTSGQLTKESCATFCDGFTYYGMENGSTCYCGTDVIGDPVTAKNCLEPCAGDSTESCGGTENQMNLWQQ